MKRIRQFIITTSFVFTSTTAFAQAKDIFELESTVLGLLGKLASTLVVLALMLFFWGLVKFIKNSSDTKEHEEGKQFIVWGLISFLVIFSVWGLVELLLGDFGITTNSVNFIFDN